jgi:Cytochrome b5-like Heme/Steroid binding domain
MLLILIIVQEESKSRTLILIAGFIHDLSSFLDHHPGGRNHLIRGSGKEMTASFFGGVYTHSNAAHNVSCGLPPRSTTNLIRMYIASVNDANRRIRWRRRSGVPT